MRVFGCLLFLGSLVQGADLSKIDRKIAVAPKFAAKEQFYALLVLGPEAETKVWFVVDGESLYVDRNGNGDLTDDGAPTPADATHDTNALISYSRSWKVGTLAVSPRYSAVEAHFALVNPAWRPKGKASGRSRMERYMAVAAKTPHANSSFLWLTIDGKRRQSGSAMFTTSPGDAPVFHLDGPLTLGVHPLVPAMLGRGHDADDLRLFVGTPGLGGGHGLLWVQPFSVIGYDELPEAARPQVEVEFPAKNPGEYLAPVRFTLDGKC